MSIIERDTSPDGLLTVLVTRDADGEIAVGFDGGDWHTHPDLLALWLGVPEDVAVTHFLAMLRNDELPIVMSTNGGETIDPYVSDNLSETLRAFGPDRCVLRDWSGRKIDAGAARRPGNARA